MRKNKLIFLFLLLSAVILLVACGGKEEQAVQEEGAGETQQPQEQEEPKAEEETVPAGDAANGKTVFQNNCLACHGTEGAGGHNGPNLQTSSISDDVEQVIQRVKEGGESMPSFEGMMSEEEIHDVAAYINEVVAPMAD